MWIHGKCSNARGGCVIGMEKLKHLLKYTIPMSREPKYVPPDTKYDRDRIYIKDMNIKDNDCTIYSCSSSQYVIFRSITDEAWPARAFGFCEECRYRVGGI